ncbi:unnamed protein product [Rotaria sordida]|uniref:Uncharacterized protein n=2 Tax=Rotaria sordida TaxID=392033 RepID=A0A815H3R1_9BILA|nr:unnamed protein product [Rotaria sordida]
MPLSSAERFRIFKAKLNLEENKLLLEKFREKDAARHRKYRRIIKKNPTKLEKIREQNRKRQAKRRLKLRSQKINSHLNEISSQAISTPPYKCPQTLAKAVHRSERSLPASPTKKKEIIRRLAIKNGVVVQPVIQSRSTDISEDTKNKVIQFYQLDEISSVATGKKDFVIIDSPDGSKVKVQKRYLVMTVQEVYEQFKLNYPNEKVGSTSFSLLRPKHVLPMSDIPQNVCLCKCHANIDLLLCSLSSILKTPKTTASFREALVCNSNSEKCMSLKCEKCGELKNFDKLFEYDNDIGGKDLLYHQWETIDSKIVKIEKSGTIQDAIDDLKSKTKDFLMHSFITHVQYIHFEDCKQNASPKSIVLQIDFSENYRTKYQDEIQNAFFNYKQVGLFNAVVWSGSNSPVINYSLISDDVSHDKYSIHVFLTKIIINLKNKFPSLETINIFSDGAASQFKQRFSFANLTFLSNDHRLNFIWNFFSSGHGRGAVDGVGGSVKRLVWKGVMAKQCIISNANDFAHYATAVAKNIIIIYVDVQDIKFQSSLLDQRWDQVRAVPNTLQIHYVKALSLYNIEVKTFSKSTDKKKFCLKS